MTEAVLFLAGIAAIAWGIWLLDWLARRRDRHARNRAA